MATFVYASSQGHRTHFARTKRQKDESEDEVQVDQELYDAVGEPSIDEDYENMGNRDKAEAVV